MRAANFCDLAASPIMIGTIGCVPGLIVRPRSVRAARKYFVFSSSLSRNSVEALSNSSAFNDAATTGGAIVFENKYGRDRSEERRVGKEGRSRWSPDHLKKKKNIDSELR